MAAGIVGAAGVGSSLAQERGDRPPASTGLQVLNPRGRVPVSWIIDDSTCLVNLNKFAMPQFDAAFGGSNAVYQRNWRDWPNEIPDRFVREFGEWCASQGVRGKFSVVPYPAAVGRLDRFLPGWSQKELRESLEMIRTVMMPNWDIHPEMVTHTRVIDLKTGQPFADSSLKFMENWEWTTGRGVGEIADYMAYALGILKEAGLACEGVTTPGGFGVRALPQLAQATLQSVRSVFGAEIPHYFRHLFDRGADSVAPRVEYARRLDSDHPECVVSIVACTGDWTGGWDNTPPGGADRFITSDLGGGRMVEIIARGEPAIALSHWTGIYFNGEEQGFQILKEVVRRLKARFDNLIWMKLREIARYWAARELTTLSADPTGVSVHAPFACPDFTLRLPRGWKGAPVVVSGAEKRSLREASRPLLLEQNTWARDGEAPVICFDLARGGSRIEAR